MTWHLWGEAAAMRLEELEYYLEGHTDGPIAEAAKKEAAHLRYLRDHGADPTGKEGLQ